MLLVRAIRSPASANSSSGSTARARRAVLREFAWDEGEGDRSRTWWMEAHKRYFSRQAARERFVMHDDIETVFERFELVWT
jgi:uncharacterized protein YhfF